MVRLVLNEFLGDTRNGTIACLYFLGLGVHDDLGIYVTILALSGAFTSEMAYAASSVVITLVSMASSSATIVLFHNSLNGLGNFLSNEFALRRLNNSGFMSFCV